ncbi:MAG TPA: lipoate--protein ligase family protein [Gemmatimonadaceae bacterium]
MAKAIWRLLLTPAADGAQNMALDEALMTRARETGEFTLRVYSWAAPTLSLGRNQSARRVYDLDRIRARRLSVVRRPTGGRAILHHREITYSVTAPADDAGDLHDSYHRINRVLVAGLERLGVRTELAAPVSRAVAPGAAPCFDFPSAGELVLDGRKLAGSAQWRSDGALLQHGSILVEDDQSALAELTLEPQRAIPAPATLAAALGHTPSQRDVADALSDAVRELEDPDAEELSLEPEIRARAAALVVHYEDDAWTWRR